eukprot:NODE_1755_length_851_cov_122.400249_g1383_i0.p3 GENE.NODE_1755_length_851_cov_122.400249_g1383_i0~~NODE_1755_length_851_cov_122.400249_g1383_i0.p3  ORF type:complete len:101 (+),score=27.82 NODE_1755_length_851_cov_122.400249_g1383_i0:149-451(+)
MNFDVQRWLPTGAHARVRLCTEGKHTRTRTRTHTHTHVVCRVPCAVCCVDRPWRHARMLGKFRQRTTHNTKLCAVEVRIPSASNTHTHTHTHIRTGTARH